MTKQTRNFLFQIIVGSFSIVAFVVFIAIISDEESSSNNNDFSKYLENSNFPIDSYFINDEQVKKEKEGIYQERIIESNQKEKEEEERVSSRVDKLKKELLAKQQSFSKNIFNNDKEELEKLNKKKEEEKRKELLNKIYNSKGLTIENSLLKIEEKRDYGANKFDNYNGLTEATNQTKLYRTITADKMIPLILLNNIDTGLSGKVIAQVEKDVYSTMGKVLLVPKGSKAIGYYEAGGQLGLNRFPLFWERMITPYGNHIYFNDESTITNDIIGNSGMLGVSDNKYLERYGIPLMLSTISNGILLAISKADKKGDIENNIVIDGSRQDINFIMKKIISEQIKIQPKITVQAGSRLFLSSKDDIWFPEPKNGEIQVKYFKKKRIFKEDK